MLESNFDIIEYLDDKGIPYNTFSKHTSHGFINIQCPFCDDESDHLGIHISSKKANCWRCGGKHITKIIQILEGCCSLAEANTILHRYQTIYIPEPEQPYIEGRSTWIPKEAVSEFPTQHLEYLINRRFDPETLIPQYDLRAIVNSHRYKQRILIPFHLNDRIVTFTTLDITDRQTKKYDACPENKSILSTKNTLYNIDTVGGVTLITEGITDVWRIGAGVVATMGTAFTNAQIDLLRTKQLISAIVMYDGEDYPKKHYLTLQIAKKLAYSLLAVVRNRNVEIIEMSHGDPDELTNEQVKKLRNEIF